MGLYDSVVLESVDLPEFPGDELRSEDGFVRRWQTKDLARSMETYRVNPETDLLERRVPALAYPHSSGEGYAYRDERVVEDAERWRYARYTGELEIVDAFERDLYEYALTFEHGAFRGAELLGIGRETFESPDER